MAITRRHLGRQACTVKQPLQIKVIVAMGCHQLQMIAQSKSVFHFDFGQAIASFAGQFPDKLLAMAQARKKKVDVQLLKVPGINHLLVPATTGEVSEYPSLGQAEVMPAVPAGIGAWLAKTLGPGKTR